MGHWKSVIGAEKEEPMEMGDYQKAIEYLGKLVIGTEKGQPMEVSVVCTTPWVTIEKPLSTMKSI